MLRKRGRIATQRERSTASRLGMGGGWDGSWTVCMCPRLFASPLPSSAQLLHVLPIRASPTTSLLYASHHHTLLLWLLFPIQCRRCCRVIAYTLSPLCLLGSSTSSNLLAHSHQVVFSLVRPSFMEEEHASLFVRRRRVSTDDVETSLEASSATPMRQNTSSNAGDELRETAKRRRRGTSPSQVKLAYRSYECPIDHATSFWLGPWAWTPRTRRLAKG
jgi:hypothetical protein